MKTADGLPGFGIVAAVLGIVITMGGSAVPLKRSARKWGGPRRHVPGDSPLLRVLRAAFGADGISRARNCRSSA